MNFLMKIYYLFEIIVNRMCLQGKKIKFEKKDIEYFWIIAKKFIAVTS